MAGTMTARRLAAGLRGQSFLPRRGRAPSRGGRGLSAPRVRAPAATETAATMWGRSAEKTTGAGRTASVTARASSARPASSSPTRQSATKSLSASKG